MIKTSPLKNWTVRHVLQVGFPKKQALSRRFSGSLFGSVLGINTYGRKGRAAELGARRNGTKIQYWLHFHPNPGKLKLKWPITGLNWRDFYTPSWLVTCCRLSQKSDSFCTIEAIHNRLSTALLAARQQVFLDGICVAHHYVALSIPGTVWLHFFQDSGGPLFLRRRRRKSEREEEKEEEEEEGEGKGEAA